MRANGIKAKGARRFKRHSHRHHLYHDSKNLLLGREAPKGMNEVWVGDVTYIRVGKDWQYLSTVLDLYTRKVIGWHFSKVRDTALVSEALHMALEERTPTDET
ncbi:MAG: DDE-type integrase/transposase/recombinase, partial [candidate division Zixibacteria bacterium]|nr:DDE-type integrase/transposase/recombinase [candidate division Zixibacteria bacterium]